MNSIQSLLGIFAHPDDEAYRAGGALAMVAQKGIPVWALYATRGEQGILNLDPVKAGQVRQAELECACTALGINAPHFLEYQDGSLFQVDEDQAVGEVVFVIRKLKPQVVLTWPPSGVSGHPDHVAVSKWAAIAFKRAADPAAYPEHQKAGLSSHAVAALYHIVVPDTIAESTKMTYLHTVPAETVTVKLDVSEVWDIKMAAIKCHKSQIDASPILEKTEVEQKIFLGTEFYQLAALRNNKKTNY